MKINYEEGKKIGLSENELVELAFSDIDKMIDILIRNPQSIEFIKNTLKENGKEFDLEEISNKLYERLMEYAESPYNYNDSINYGYPHAIRRFLKKVNYDERKIEIFDKKIEDKIDSNITEENLIWFANIKKLKLSGKTIDDIPKEERILYKMKRVDSRLKEISYNWDEIAEISKIKNLPKGMEEMFWKNKQGEIVGENYINWEYFKNLKTKHYIFRELPPYIGITLEAIEIEDYDELHENMPIKNFRGWDSNYPKEITNNKKIMIELFNRCDEDEIEDCFELMSEELKNDVEFLKELLEIENVRMSDIEDIINESIEYNLDSKEEIVRKQVEEEFNLFIKKTKNEFKRPPIIMKDGIKMSVQASAFHYSYPNKSGLEDYESYEVSCISEIIEQLIEYAEDPIKDNEQLLKVVYPNVPKETIIEIIQEHGGLDIESTLKKNIELGELKQEKDQMEDKNRRMQEAINQFMMQIGNILGD